MLSVELAASDAVDEGTLLGTGENDWALFLSTTALRSFGLAGIGGGVLVVFSSAFSRSDMIGH